MLAAVTSAGPPGPPAHPAAESSGPALPAHSAPRGRPRGRMISGGSNAVTIGGTPS